MRFSFLLLSFLFLLPLASQESEWASTFQSFKASFFNGFFTPNITVTHSTRPKISSRIKNAVKAAAIASLADVMAADKQSKHFLSPDDPASKLSQFSAPRTDCCENGTRLAYAALFTAKRLKNTLNVDFGGNGVGRERDAPKISLRKTVLESLCPPREPPICPMATRKYRTNDGICNNLRHLRWGSANMPFHRFLAPEYSDGIDTVRNSVTGGLLPSARFVSIVVHGDASDESPVTMMLPMWGQFIDHDLTSTTQPKSINGRVPSCCQPDEIHPACMPIKVPDDDPWLGPLGVKCLEFLRSAPASRRDCTLSWREQSNQATSFLDASMIYSSNPRLAENSRLFRDGLLVFGKSSTSDDVCRRGGISSGCVKAGDSRSGEQPGLLAMHQVFVAEHNRIALDLSDLNPHWSDEKLYQEARRLIGAMVQHITFREFLPLVLGREVMRLFELELRPSGFFEGYDPKVNPTVANSFASAAFRFGHSMVQKTLMRSDRGHNFIKNNVSLHEESESGDMGGPGSLHRLLRGLVNQRAAKRDEFVTAELTNHLFQSSPFPFGLDLAAINIQRGRDHGLPPFVSWRQPCGLSPVKSWEDLDSIVGPASAKRIRLAYHSIDDVDLFVAGLAERPVSGGLVGPTFACIIAQQFSNLRKGDRFWYENVGFDNSFTPAQLQSIRRTSLAQVLCRSLEGGTLQPHIFLPSTFPQNSRQTCGQDDLLTIDLTPWTEHDPFREDASLTDGQKKEPLLESPFSTSNNEISNKLDLEAIDKLHVDKRPDSRPDPRPSRPPTTRKTTTTKTFKPSKLQTKKPVDTKLDFSTTKKRASTAKRPLLRNSTKALNKKDQNLINGTTKTKKRKRTKRKTTAPVTSTTLKGWFVIKDTDDDPTKDWILLEDRKERSRPIGFQNNRPIFAPDETPDSPTTPPTHGQSNEPDIKYWQKFINTITPPTSISYDIEIPLLSTSTTKKTKIRPTSTDKNVYIVPPTTKKVQTLLHKAKPFISVTTDDPLTYFISSTTAMSSLYHPEISYPQPSDSLDVQHTFSSSYGHQAPKPWSDSFNLVSVSLPSTTFTTTKKRPTTTTTSEPPPVTDPDDIYYFNDCNWERLDVDPETPVDHIKYYYVDNVLHKVEPHGIFRKRPTKLYDPEHPDKVVPYIKQMVGTLDSREQAKLGPMTDLLSDQDSIHWIRKLDDGLTVQRRDLDMPLKSANSKSLSQKHVPISLVPLKILTNVERKDNWVNVEPVEKTLPLPDLPDLEYEGRISNEIPRPMKNL